jgi:hypothetical protein
VSAITETAPSRGVKGTQSSLRGDLENQGGYSYVSSVGVRLSGASLAQSGPAGLKKSVRPGVAVNASRSVEADVVLKGRAATEPVTVTASAAVTPVDTARIESIAENRQMMYLAVKGRNPFCMAEVEPGAIGEQFNSLNPDTRQQTTRRERSC